MVDAEKAAVDSIATAEQGLRTVSRGLANTAAATQQVVTESYGTAVHWLDHAKEYVDYGAATVKVLQDVAVDGVKGAVNYASNNPYTAYSSAAGAAVLILPGTRRLLWRYTLGRFSSPTDVIKRSEETVNRLKSQALDYTAKAKTLEERMLLGEEELKAGYIKLKSARKEMQQLASSVASSQAKATGVVRNLRAIKHVDGSLAVRGEAANQAKEFKEQLAQLNKNVYRIANKDI